MQKDVICTFSLKSLSHRQIGEVLKAVGTGMQERGLSQYMIRKVYSVTSESLENVYTYHKKNPALPKLLEFTVYIESTAIYVIVKNSILPDDFEELSRIIDNLNTLKGEELKPFFQKKIKERGFDAQGGAGVGLIIIKRKTDYPIEVSHSLENNVFFISLTFELEIGSMKKFKKLATKHTPLINFNLTTQRFIIQGHSRPENADAFYQEVYDWVELHSSELQAMQNMVLHVDLEYFNSVSLKNLLRLLRQFFTINPQGIIVEWYYDKDDESLKEDGVELSEILKHEFVFIEKSID